MGKMFHLFIYWESLDLPQTENAYYVNLKRLGIPLEFIIAGGKSATFNYIIKSSENYVNLSDSIS
jgi:hypothetical protein